MRAWEQFWRLLADGPHRLERPLGIYDVTQPDEAAPALATSSSQLKHTADPFSATMLGVAGFDGLVPDPGRAGSAAEAASWLTKIETGWRRSIPPN